MRLSAVVAAVLVVLAAGCALDEPLEGELLVTADRLFDGARVVEEGGVLIGGGAVLAAGPIDDLHVRAERTLDLGNATLLPGFVDLHVHAYGEGLLVGGVTTVRDLGIPLAALPPPRPKPGHLRIFAAGPIVTVPGGYPGTVHDPSVGLPVRGPAAARAVVDDLVNAGASVIKISLEPGGANDWPMLSATEVRAIVRAAHRRGRIVTAHVSDSRGVELALAGGVDELAHAPCELDPELMREVAQRRIAIVGTLHVVRCPEAVGNMAVFVRAGGKLLYGSDYGNPGIPPRIDVEELRLMTRAGLSRQEAIAAATSKAAAYLGLEPLGSLVAGAPADIVGVEGDPFRDVGALRRLVFLSAGGWIVIERGKVNLPVQ